MKSLKTTLHQKAYRIGKIEARIRKLESALSDVQAKWPEHVQRAQQQLRTDYGKYLQFQQVASIELAELRQELQQLSLLGQGVIPQMHLDATTVQAAMEILTAAGVMKASYTGANPPMRTWK